jgi:hypothetical protein
LAAPDTAKPATARHGEPASNLEQLGGQLDHTNNGNQCELQARRLCRLYTVSFDIAVVLAPFVFAVVPR